MSCSCSKDDTCLYPNIKLCDKCGKYGVLKSLSIFGKFFNHIPTATINRPWNDNYFKDSILLKVYRNQFRKYKNKNNKQAKKLNNLIKDLSNKLKINNIRKYYGDPKEY